MPLARATRGLRRRTGSPSTVTVPLSARSAPKSRRAVSVRPDPSSPAMPSTSPLRSSRSSGATPDFRPSPVGHRGTSAATVASARHATSCSSASSTASSRPIILETSCRRGSSGREVLADEAPVAQHGDAVGDAVHLIEEVGDEQHGDTRCTDPLDDLEQLVDLACVEARRRLVEDQHLGVDLHGAGDGHELLDGDRVRFER